MVERHRRANGERHASVCTADCVSALYLPTGMLSSESDSSNDDFEMGPSRRVKSRREHGGAASPGRRRGDGGSTRRIVVIPPHVLARMGDIVQPAPVPAAVSRDSSSQVAPTPAASSSPEVEFLASIPPEDEAPPEEDPEAEDMFPYAPWMYEDPSYLGGYSGTGFTERALSGIPDFKPSDGDPLPDDSNCSICKEDMIEGHTLKKLACGHVYHKDCIFPWLGQSKHCPLCRVRLEL